MSQIRWHSLGRLALRRRLSATEHAPVKPQAPASLGQTAALATLATSGVLFDAGAVRLRVPLVPHAPERA